MKLRKGALVFSILLILIGSTLLQFTSVEHKAFSEKTAIFLKLSVYTGREASFEFYIGSGAKQQEKARSTITRDNWRKECENIWKSIPEIVYGEFGSFIRDKFNTTDSAEDFVELVLGCENIVKRISFVNYSEGLGFSADVYLKVLDLKPLKFLRDFPEANIPALADVNINIDSEHGVESSELLLLHFRLVTREILIYSSIKNDLHLVNVAALSPFGGFIVLVACTALSLSLCFYSRKYFRGEKLYTPLWILAWLFYLCAFIPFSNYIFISICTVGVSISSAKVTRSILKARPKLPKKEVIEPKKVGEKVEKYLK
ncbi:MAG: hypothetical protein QME47_04255 [Candidatus Thermoplasmatota archaeon]|nr:hypothetical protein [Candidatus Thermoplasmatota archaeon]